MSNLTPRQLVHRLRKILFTGENSLGKYEYHRSKQVRGYGNVWPGIKIEEDSPRGAVLKIIGYHSTVTAGVSTRLSEKLRASGLIFTKQREDYFVVHVQPEPVKTKEALS